MARFTDIGNFTVSITSDLDRVRPGVIQNLVDKAKSLGLEAGIISINEDTDEIQIEKPNGALVWHDRIRDIYK